MGEGEADALTVIERSNGDTTLNDASKPHENAFDRYETEIGPDPLVIFSDEGTSCDCAFPFMRLCFPEYINDGKKFEGAPVWAPKLEEYSAGIDIYCGVELDKEYIVDTVVVYSTDIGNKPGNGNKFEIQAPKAVSRVARPLLPQVKRDPL